MDEKILKEELDLRNEIQTRLNKIKKIKRKIKDLEEDIKKLRKMTK